MHKIVLVHVVEGRYYLEHYFPRWFLWQLFLLHEEVEQLLSFAELGDDVDVGGGLENLVHFYDVGVVLV